MDTALGFDSLGVSARLPLGDLSRGTTHWVIRRYDEESTLKAIGMTGKTNPSDVDFARLSLRSYRTTEVVGNLITNAGWTRLMSLLTVTGSTQALSATAVRIGVGNSNTAEAYTDTDLGASAGSTNRWFQIVTGAASLGTRTTAFSASFASADGNFAWNEFGIDVGTPTVSSGNTVAALLFNHKAGIAQGTKASGQVWTATATITFT